MVFDTRPDFIEVQQLALPLSFNIEVQQLALSPNSALQQTLAPAILFAVAKSTSAVSAAELRRWASIPVAL